MKAKVFGVLVKRVLQRFVVCYYCFGESSGRGGIPLHIPFDKLPVNKVGFHNVMANHSHEFGVLDMSAVQSGGQANDFRSMQFGASVSSFISFEVSILVPFGSYTKGDVFMGRVSFDPAKPA